MFCFLFVFGFRFLFECDEDNEELYLLICNIFYRLALLYVTYHLDFIYNLVSKVPYLYETKPIDPKQETLQTENKQEK